MDIVIELDEQLTSFQYVIELLECVVSANVWMVCNVYLPMSSILLFPFNHDYSTFIDSERFIFYISGCAFLWGPLDTHVFTFSLKCLYIVWYTDVVSS